MRSRNAELTVVAIVLLLGASPSYAENAATSPGQSPSAPVFQEDAGFSGYLGDDTELQMPTEVAPRSSQAASHGDSPFAQTPGFQGDAGFRGYVGDDSELTIRPKAIPKASQAAFEYDDPGAKPGMHQKAGKKGGPEVSVKDDEDNGPWVYRPWVSFEYLSTWLQGRFLPPLVTTSPPGAEGVLPGARMLFGGDEMSGNRQVAGKLSMGAWLTPAEQLGVGGSFFQVQTETMGFGAASNGGLVLARPIYETWPSADGGVGPAAFLVTGQTFAGTTPFTLAGDIQAVTHTDVMGAEGYLRYLLFCAPGRRLDLIGGYQFSRVDDSLQINHTTTYTPQTFARSFEAEDLFDTVNKFHGGELGLLGEYGKGPVMLSMLAKLGMGNMNEVVTISGNSSLTDAGGGVAYYNGGILALPTNIGVYKQDKFTVIPEAEVKLIFKLARHAEVSIGYNFIYWSTLALAGNQIQSTDVGPVVNSSQWFGGAVDPAGGPYPAFGGIKDSSLWLQGISVGFTLRR